MKYQGQTQTSMTLATKTNLNLNTYLHTSSNIFTNPQTSSHIFTHLHKSSNIFTHLHTSPHIFTNLHTSSHIFTHLHTSPHIFTNLHTSSQILKHLHTSSHIFTHLHTSPHIFTNLHTSSRIFTHLHTSPHIFTNLHTSSHIFTHLHTSPHISTHLHKSPNIFTHLHKSPHIFTHLHKSSNIFTHLHTSPHISTHLHKSSHIFTHLHTSPHISTHLHKSSHIFTPWRWQPVRLGCQRTWGRAWERALQEIWSIQELCIPLPQTWRSWIASEKLPQKSQGIKCTQLSQHISPFLNLSEPRPHLSLITIAPYCTRTQSHLYILLPAWQSPSSKSKIIQHPATACGFGSCHASAQPRVGAWRRPGHRLRRGQGGPRSPPEAAPWNQNKYINEWDKENSERDFIVNLFPNTGSSVFTCRWLKATYHRKFCEMQSKLRAEHLAHLRTHLRIRRDTLTNESCALADMLPIYSTSHLLWQTMCKLTVKLTDTGWAKLRRGESV